MLYLAIDYLNQAVTSRRDLLSRCLVSVPQHLQHLETYPHEGKIPDDSYRCLSKIAKHVMAIKDKESPREYFLATDDLKRTYNAIEPYDSASCEQADISIQNCVNFDLDCDVIPNSLPGTPDVFTPDEFFAESTIFQECFNTECLKAHIKEQDKLTLEEQIPTDTQLEDSLYTVPRLPRLLSQLPPLYVTDPLVGTDGVVLDESLIFRDFALAEESGDEGHSTSVLKDSIDCSLIQDSFIKYQDQHRLRNEKEMESPLVDGAVLPSLKEVAMTTAEFVTVATIPRDWVPVNEETSILKEFTDAFLHVGKIDTGRLETFSSPRDQEPTITFLDVNEIIFTEKDRFCEKAVLQTPVSSPIVGELEPNQLPLPERTKIPVKTDGNRFLSKLEEAKLTRKNRNNEKFFDEVQSSRLPEPVLSESEDLESRDTIREAVKIMNVSPDFETGKQDLKLSWLIVQAASCAPDPTKCLLKLDLDMTDCEVSIKPMESVQKYSAMEMYDWNDPIIGVNSGELIVSTSTLDRSKNTASSKRVSDVSSSSGFDPLQQFMMMRSKSVKEKQTNYLLKVHVPATETEVKVEEAVEEYPMKDASMAKRRQQLDSRKKAKHHVVKVKITEEYQDILDRLTSSAAVHLEALIQTGDVSQDSTFHTITPDISRFLLKQRQKYLAENLVSEADDVIFRHIVCLHALASTADITANCCLEAALIHLGVVHDQYRTVISGSLDSIREQLFELKAQFNKSRYHHPKVVALCKEIEVWLKKKRAKSKEKDCDQKILILIEREMPSLLDCIKNALSLSKQLSPVILDTSDSDAILTCLDEHNCVLAQQRLITDHFPWAQFSFVVEFEHKDQSPWQQLCGRQHIRHVGLQLEVVKRDGTARSTEWVMQYPDRQITLIASHTITRNIELLQLLEARFNIMLLERDYNQFRSVGLRYFSDLDVDENTGIILQDLHELVDDCAAEGLVTRVTALSLKYTEIWVILTTYCKNGFYILPGHVVSNLSKLQATLSNFVIKYPGITVKSLQCDSTSEMASIVRQVSEMCMTANKHRPLSGWLHRTWLTQKMSKVEKFLLMFPCLSSFNAQLLVREKAGVQNILSSSVDNLAQTFPWLASKTLQIFVKLSSSSSGLKLRDMDRSMTEDTSPVVYSDLDDDGSKTKTGTKLMADTKSELSDFENDRPTIYSHEDFQYDTGEKITKTNDVDDEAGYYQKPGIAANNSLPGDTMKEKENVQNRYFDKNYSETPFTRTTMAHKLDTKDHQLKDYICNQEIESSYPFIATKIPNSTPTTETRSEDKKHLTLVEKLNRQRHKEHQPVQRKQIPLRYNGNELDLENQKIQDVSVGYTRIEARSASFQQPAATEPDIQHFSKDTALCSKDAVQVSASTGNVFHNEIYKLGERMAFFQNQIGTANQQPTTFDNNHGLSIIDYGHKSAPTTVDPNMQDINHKSNVTDLISNKSANDHRNVYSYQTNIYDFEKEFLPAEGIDKEVSKAIRNESLGIASNENAVPGKGLHDYHSDLYMYDPVVSKTDYTVTRNDDTHPPYIGSHLKTDINNTLKDVNLWPRPSFDSEANLATSTRPTQILNISCERESNPVDINAAGPQFSTEAYYDYNSDFPERREVRFAFNPVTIDENLEPGLNTSAEELLERNNRSLCQEDKQRQILQVHHEEAKKNPLYGKVYFNPSMERLTTRPVYIQEKPVSVVTQGGEYARTLEDNLRETTRKLLENSKQFSRFTCQPGKHHLQKVSIGLAQPLQRPKRTTVIDNRSRPDQIQDPTTDTRRSVAVAEKMKLAMSPWASGDSPPLDLDYDSTTMDEMLYPGADNGHNNAVFNSHTPSKRRRLTYQKIPGKKGQTKLIFQ